MSELTYYQRNRDVILNRAKVYYENDKERLREQTRDKYRNLSEEDKNKKKEYGKYLGIFIFWKVCAGFVGWFLSALLLLKNYC